jgi:hypothetical protein
VTREPWKPALEDPCDPDNNIGQVWVCLDWLFCFIFGFFFFQATFNLPRIRDAMAETFEIIKKHKYDSPNDRFGVLPKIFLAPHSERLK